MNHFTVTFTTKTNTNGWGNVLLVLNVIDMTLRNWKQKFLVHFLTYLKNDFLCRLPPMISPHVTFTFKPQQLSVLLQLVQTLSIDEGANIRKKWTDNQNFSVILDYRHNVLFAANDNSSGNTFISRIGLDDFSLFGRLRTNFSTVTHSDSNSNSNSNSDSLSLFVFSSHIFWKDRGWSLWWSHWHDVLGQ
jgi:hypothetical protein